MDFSRPASADPRKLLAAANDWQVTQAFASPAVWRVLSEHCAKTGERIESLRQVFSCGAPVPADVLRATLACVGHGAKMHTPYGATECLPVATIEAAEVLGETAARTDRGRRRLRRPEVRFDRVASDSDHRRADRDDRRCGGIADGRNRRTDRARAAGVAAMYVTRVRERNAGESKIRRCEHGRSWHRMGDVGYLDDAGPLLVLRAQVAARRDVATGRCSPSASKPSSTRIRTCGDRHSSALGRKAIKSPVVDSSSCRARVIDAMTQNGRRRTNSRLA